MVEVILRVPSPQIICLYVCTLHEHAPLYKRSVYLDLRVYPGSAFFGVIFWKSVLVLVSIICQVTFCNTTAVSERQSMLMFFLIAFVISLQQR